MPARSRSPADCRIPGETLSQTALREAFEEIGLDPGTTEVVGALPAVHTTVSGILIVPFVGMVESLPAFVVSEREIEEVLTFTVAQPGGGGTSGRGGAGARARLARFRVRARRLHDLGSDGVDAARPARGHPEGGVVADPDVNGPVAPEDRELRALLGDAHTIAVVGLSSKPDRPSNGVAALPPGARLPHRAR